MAAKRDTAILKLIRKRRDAWLVLPPGEERVAVIRDDFLPWVFALLQDLNVHTAMAEIGSRAAAGVTGNDREARQDRVLKGYPAMLNELRLILPTNETDLVIGDLKAMDAGHAPLALYPRKAKQVDKRRREVQDRCVLRAEYDAGLLGMSRKKVLEQRNTPGKLPLPVSRLNRWALRLSTEQTQLFHSTGEKKRTGAALSAEEQKALEAVERNTLEELIKLAIDMGGLSGSRRRYRPPPAASDQGGVHLVGKLTMVMIPKSVRRGAGRRLRRHLAEIDL
jgi:hypothetical protein